MAAFTREQIALALDAKSRHLEPDDVARIVANPDYVGKVVDEFPDSWSKAKRQARLLFELIEAASKGTLDVPFDAQKLAAGALLYLAAPLDLVPDDEKDGFADDAAIVSRALSLVESQARKLCEISGKNAAEYFD